jgi:hypothetical protein
MSPLDKLKAGQSAIARVNLGDDVEIGLRILTEQDYLSAQIATDQAMKAEGLELNISTSEAFEAEKTSQLLLRSMVDIDTGELLAKSAKHVRTSLSRDQKNVLISAYLEHEQQFSPMAGRNMGEHDFNDLLDTLKKTPEKVNLNDLNSGTLKRLIVVLASPPVS